MILRLLNTLTMCALILYASNGMAATHEDTAPSLKFTEDNFDFGCVGVDFRVYHTFKLVNQGRDTIHIDTVTAHCDCTQVRFRDSTLAPGDTARILMIFDTGNKYGPEDKDIRVISSDKGAPRQEIHYLANIGQWLFQVEPRPVSVFFLPNQKVKTAVIFNHALEKITIKDVYLDSNIVDVKVIRDEASKGEGLEFELTPRADLGAGTHLTSYTVTMDIHSNAPPHKITIPVKVVRY